MQIYETSSGVAVLQKHNNYFKNLKKSNYAYQRALKFKIIVGPIQNYHVIQNELVFCSVEVNNFPKLISLCNTEVTLKR